MKVPGIRLLVVCAVVLASALLIACSNDDGEDRPSVDVIEDSGSGSGSGSVSASGTGSGSVSASGTGSGSVSASGQPAEPGVVENKPASATQVDVTLREFEISAEETTAQAGKLYFLVENEGPDDAHEFVVIRTDEAPDALPVEEGRVPEDDVDIVDEIEPFAPGSSASITLDLEPGKYVFICNIAEVEDGQLESHYQEGMRLGFTVQLGAAGERSFDDDRGLDAAVAHGHRQPGDVTGARVQWRRRRPSDGGRNRRWRQW